MLRRFLPVLLGALSAAAFASGANAYLQADGSASLRASGKVGEQADGYLGLVESEPSLRAQVDAINIKRRAYYTDLAAKRGAKIEEVAAATACEILASRVQPGQFYRLSDGQWRKRDAGAAVQRPAYCG
jgi:uncharacterized protein YdbL (DUF1318 family)